MVNRISRPSGRGVAIVLAGALAASCMVGPNYTRPAVPTPAGFRGGDTPATNVSLADTKWFDLFQDQTLTQLVNGALQQNFDLRIAAERVLQARALFRVTRADQFPTVDASAAIIQTRIPTVGASAGIPPDAVDRDFGYAQAGFNLGWEIDVWGRLRRLTESARAQYFATEEARRGVVTTLVADVTETYLALRALDLELAIARRTQQVATDSLRLTQTRFDRGIATALDVQQAEQLLRIAGVQNAGLERDIAQTENALSLLLGQVPGDIPRGLELEAFRLPPTVPAGLPSALLERRPDIRQAEQQLIAANARIGAAKAEYFPRISLTGVLGLQSRSLGDLLTGAATNWTLAAGATAPIFNAGRTGGKRPVHGGAAARAGRQLPEDDLHRAARSLGLARGLSQDERSAVRAGTAGRRAADIEPAVDRALPGWRRHLPSGAGCAAQPVSRGAGSRAAAPAGAVQPGSVVSRARWRLGSRLGEERHDVMNGPARATAIGGSAAVSHRERRRWGGEGAR